MINRIILIAAMLYSATLFGYLDGRIDKVGIPSLIADVSIEKAEMTYNAPVLKYFNVNFGMITQRYNIAGLCFGIASQWVSSNSVNGVVRLMPQFLIDRNATELFMGGSLDTGINFGSKKSGFFTTLMGKFLISTQSTKIASAGLKMGAYVSPIENVVLSVGPGFGHSFFTNANWYIDFSFSLEAYLWK